MRRYLPSVVRYSEPLGEVVVADNASDDDSLRVLATEFASVRVDELDRNYGFAEGYNRAIAQVATPYVLLLNSDVEVTPGYLEPLYEYMERHADVAAVQPKLLAEWRRTHFEYAGAAGGYLDRLGYPFCRGRIFDNVEQDEGQYDTVADVHWTTGAAMLVRTHIYNKVGGLDGRFFAHMEEIDLCWRMRNQGYRLCCVPQSTVYHVGGGTLPQGSPHKTYLNFRNNLLMIHNNHPQAAKVQACRWWLDALASMVFLLKGRLGEFCAVWRAWCAFGSTRRDFAQMPGPAPLAGSILWAYYIKRRRTWKQLCI